MNKLNEIQITNGNIETIGTDAFYDLPNLVHLYMPKNQIVKIEPFAFRQRQQSNVTLLIDLTENQLTIDSFSTDSLLGAKRYVLCSLHWWESCWPTTHSPALTLKQLKR